MTDVAALIAEANEWLARRVMIIPDGLVDRLAAELTRLAAERDAIDTGHRTLSRNYERAVAERDDAKAEIARLRTAFEKYLKVTRPLLDDTKAWAEANAALKLDPGKSASSTHDPDTGEKP